MEREIENERERKKSMGGHGFIDNQRVTEGPESTTPCRVTLLLGTRGPGNSSEHLGSRRETMKAVSEHPKRTRTSRCRIKRRRRR